MWIFRCAIIILASTYILTACFQITNKNYFTTGLAFLLTLSGAIAGKIIYDRYQQIHILGSLTPNPNVTSFANKIASFSASFLFLGFLVYFFLFLFKSDYQYITTALNIFVCGFGTLYIWIQCILTTYLSTLFYNRNLLWFRQCLANVSFPILLILTIFGTVASFLPQGGSGGVYFCYVVTSLCTNVLVAIFCVFILTFSKEYEYFATGLRSELLLDDGCTLSNGSLDDVDSIFGTQDLPSSARVIKGSVGYAGVS